MWYVSLVTSLHYLISSSASDSLKGADDDDGKNKRNWSEGAGLGGWVWGRLKKRIPDDSVNQATPVIGILSSASAR